jgi:hypothetical protein
MIIIEPNNTEYTFSIIPSSLEETYYVRIRDEQTNTIVYNDFSVNVENNSDITDVTIQVEDSLFKENCFYNIIFYLADEVLYKGKIFCTSQKINNYSINKAKYITPSIDNNDYIII